MLGEQALDFLGLDAFGALGDFSRGWGGPAERKRTNIKHDEVRAAALPPQISQTITFYILKRYYRGPITHVRARTSINSLSASCFFFSNEVPDAIEN